MISWEIIARDRDTSKEYRLDLVSLPLEDHFIKETDSIIFKVTLDNNHYHELGTPYVVVGDIPLELVLSHQEEDNLVFSSVESQEHYSSRFFYNFFGESEIALAFKNLSEYHSTCTLNILARAENAELAAEMLSYITDNIEDAVAVCFSRSKISGKHDRNSSFEFTRLDIIEQAISKLVENLPLFIREHRHTWKTEMQLSERGQPTGPDSVYWVLSNLDKLSPSSAEESNLIYNNRSYRLDTQPKEEILNEYDVYENRVIHTFLHNISLFLIELKDNFNSSIKSDAKNYSNNYVRFDHTMQRYMQLALKNKMQHLDRLSTIVEQLRRVLVKKIPARVMPGIPLRMTSYVAKHSHYRQTFKLIELCNEAPAPSFDGKNLLLGLKNLAIVYEISSLLMLNESIKRCFSVELATQSYRLHSSELPFGGVEKERPYGNVNNYFTYQSDVFDIELFYEPQIFPFSAMSSIGDLVDTSCSRATSRYGKHHFCPDFIIKIRSKNWRKPITIVLDSKYKDAETIKNFDISSLTQKYLLNIHQVNAEGSFGVSAVQLLLILFAHDRTGSQVRTVAARHCLTGQLPVLPQASGILFKPGHTDRLDENFKALIRIIDREVH